MSTAGSPSEWVRLDAEGARAAFAAYRTGQAFFPLVGAVLEGTQDGTCWGDHATRPRQVYVEHAFGFAQVFGASLPGFEAALRQYLLVDRAFAAPKVRLYTPQLPRFLEGPEHAPLRAERQRYMLSQHVPQLQSVSARLAARPVTTEHFAAMEQAFGVALRFWRTPADFLAGARATMALVDGAPAAVCYAAAVSAGRAEIDVLTLPAFRQQGAAHFAVRRFIDRCRHEGLAPLWDCFTNNAGSVQLARAAGFVPSGAPYPFFTIGK